MTAVQVSVPDDLVEQIAQRAADLVLAELDAWQVSPYVTVAEAADYLRCKRQRIDDLLSSGRLTRHKEGGRTLISRRELEAHVLPERHR